MHHAEGWTTMLEDYMLDMGYMGELTDEARFVGKRDISRIGARVAIDLFFMTGEKDFIDIGVPCDLSSDDPFEAAGNLLTAVTGFVPGRVQAELNWYSQERGYPFSYLTGNRMVWDLKRDVAAASGLSGVELDRALPPGLPGVRQHAVEFPATRVRARGSAGLTGPTELLLRYGKRRSPAPSRSAQPSTPRVTNR